MQSLTQPIYSLAMRRATACPLVSQSWILAGLRSPPLQTLLLPGFRILRCGVSLCALSCDGLGSHGAAAGTTGCYETRPRLGQVSEKCQQVPQVLDSQGESRTSTSSRVYVPIPYWSWEGTALLASLPYPYSYTLPSKSLPGTLWG